MIMEADEGVRMILASRIITAEPEAFLVLRHPDYPWGIESSRWKEFGKSLMLMALQPEANKPYNWSGVFATRCVPDEHLSVMNPSAWISSDSTDRPVSSIAP